MSSTKFDRLRKLLGPDIEDVNFEAAKDSRERSLGKTFPQFEQYLQNARDAAVMNKAVRHQRDLRMPYWDPRHNLPVRSEPTPLDKIVLNENTPGKIRGFMHDLHIKNDYLADPTNTITRSDLGRQIAKDYTKAMYPEWEGNRKNTDTYRSVLPREILDELTHYQKQIARDISGLTKETEPKNYINDASLVGALGRYTPAEDKVEIDSPVDLYTPAHEYLHKVDEIGEIHNSFRERDIERDLARSSDLTSDVNQINSGHIMSHLDDVQQPKDRRGWMDQSIGETAAWYNQIQRLLKNEK